MAQRYSISGTCLPQQKRTEKAIRNPGEFTPDDWKFSVTGDPNGWDWRGGNAVTGDSNLFNNREPYRLIQNAIFGPLTGQEPIYGHVKYHLNPLDQEQTNAKMSAYQIQKQTRVLDNMSPLGVMRYPAYKYPVNVWSNIYQGSRRA